MRPASARRRPPDPDPIPHSVRRARCRDALVDRERRRGRGAQSNASGRFEPEARRVRRRLAEPRGTAAVQDRRSRSTPRARSSPATTRRTSPFDRSINPYRGCEHGCIYCFARPTHAYLGLSPGARFRIEALHEAGRAASCWSASCRPPNYSPRTIAIGTNTDPYQPIERRYRDHAAHPRGARPRQPSGRHRHQVARWCCATSTFSRSMAKRNLVRVAHVGDDARLRSSPG